MLVDIDGVKCVSLCLTPCSYQSSLHRYYGLIEKVYPPRFSADQQARDAFKDSDLSEKTPDEEHLHSVGSDLNIPLQEANAQDNPELYYYWVQILELEKDKGEKSKASKTATEKDTKVIGSVMECQCNTLRYAPWCRPNFYVAGSLAIV